MIIDYCLLTILYPVFCILILKCFTQIVDGDFDIVNGYEGGTIPAVAVLLDPVRLT